MKIVPRLRIPWSLLVLASACAPLGCDPVGVLRIYAVKDGPSVERPPADDVKAWIECPHHERHDLERGSGPGEFVFQEIPAINPDCVVSLQRGKGPVKSFRAGDLCVERVDRGELQCRRGFLYAPLPDGEPAPVEPERR